MDPNDTATAPIMSSESQGKRYIERRDAEVSLLQAMYPSELLWNEHRQEITYKREDGGNLVIRLSDEYPGTVRPVLISAIDRDKTDIRDDFRKHMDNLNLPVGEEVMDTIVQAFEETIRQREISSNYSQTASDTFENIARNQDYKTVIVWLHHLLNTNKRKLAVNPSVDALDVVGVTKPGYPGILVYSGRSAAVDAHVSELKDQRWQAFQIRFDEEGEDVWIFDHGSGIREVESMSEITQSIASESNRAAFLQAVGIK